MYCLLGFWAAVHLVVGLKVLRIQVRCSEHVYTHTHHLHH
jgi:hypothetical protein